MTEMKRKIILYTPLIYQIGGAETWIYNLTTALKNDFDFLVLYGSADRKQLDRLKVPSEKNKINQMYKCDILLNFFLGRPYNVDAAYTIQTIHSNYAEMPYYTFYPWHRTDEYVFSSQAAKDGFNCPLTKKWDIIENPVCQPAVTKKPRQNDGRLHLVAATRLTEEKGGMRLAMLCDKLKQKKIDFVLDVYTTTTPENYTKKIDRPLPQGMVFHQPKIDLGDVIAGADYLVQLSDCEAFCYSMHEALAIGTPVIVTDWRGVRNTVSDGINGFIVDFELSNLPSKKQLMEPPTEFQYQYNDSVSCWREKLNNINLSQLPKKSHFLDKKTNYFL